jgi:hypothetical protein
LVITGIDFFAVQKIKRENLPRAQILHVTRAVWPDGARELIQGALPERTPIELSSGLLEIGYPSGARVVVEGPCRTDQLLEPSLVFRAALALSCAGGLSLSNGFSPASTGIGR